MSFGSNGEILLDSLAYVEPLDDRSFAVAQALITRELSELLQGKPQLQAHERMPEMPHLFEHLFSFKRLGKDESVKDNTKRATAEERTKEARELLQKKGKDAPRAVLESARDRARVELETIYGKQLNLSLLEQHGAKAWFHANLIATKVRDELKKELEAITLETGAINSQRREAHEKAWATLTALEDDFQKRCRECRLVGEEVARLEKRRKV